MKIQLILLFPYGRRGLIITSPTIAERIRMRMDADIGDDSAGRLLLLGVVPLMS